MKKITLFFAIICSALFFVACSSGLTVPKNINSYNFTLTYDEVNNKLFGEEEVCYVNKSDTTLNEIKFHLYANAFREGSKANVVSLANKIKAYPNGMSYGQIDIKSVEDKSGAYTFAIDGDDQNILTVKLKTELFPDDNVTFTIMFETTLANINHRLGYGNNCINLCNFYPIACVYEDGKFVTDLYNANGDPFYSPISNYSAKMTYNKNYTISSSGTSKTKINKDTKTSEITATNVRDFGMVLSDKFKMLEKDVNGVTVKYFYHSDTKPEESLKISCETLEFFSKKIGAYPYKELNVVETNFVHGGMEYPNMVLISDTLADYETYQMVIVHEIVHQWWYGLVGNNQFNYGYLDEGLTEFCTALFFDNHPQYNRSSEQMIRAATNAYTSFMRVYTSVLGNVDTSMNRRLDEFETEPEYVYITYTKGMLMFSTVYEIVGEVNFYKCLQSYFNTYAYKEVTPQQMIDSFQKTSKKNLSTLFETWINGKVVIMPMQ